MASHGQPGPAFGQIRASSHTARVRPVLDRQAGRQTGPAQGQHHPIKVEYWMKLTLDKVYLQALGLLTPGQRQNGQLPPAAPTGWRCRVMGFAAASGMWQVIFTFDSLASAEMGHRAATSWYKRVTVRPGQRDWWHYSVRFFIPSERDLAQGLAFGMPPRPVRPVPGQPGSAPAPAPAAAPAPAPARTVPAAAPAPGPAETPSSSSATWL